jgi:hypothetical protein
VYFNKTFAISGMSLLLGMSAFVQAANLVTNGSFDEGFGDPNYSLKERFSDIKPVGWSGGDALTEIVAPGFADNGVAPSVYGPFPTTSPDGGNFVMANGDPPYRDAFYQTLNGLTVGQTYAVSFYQAAGQDLGKTGPTTERWLVSFGNTTQASDTFHLEQAGVGQWEAQTLYFQADATSNVLTFLADGTPHGAPPISFLDGVSVDAVPEPSSLALSMLGAIGFAALVGRSRNARSALVRSR